MVEPLSRRPSRVTQTSTSSVVGTPLLLCTVQLARVTVQKMEGTCEMYARFTVWKMEGTCELYARLTV